MGLKRFFQRILPHKDHITSHKNLSFLGDILHDPHIFHITRRSMSGGVALGLFLAFMPIPGQMIVAALAAIYLHVNLPLAILMVWITNPFTFAPIFIFAYKVGATILNEPTVAINFEFSISWLSDKVLAVWDVLLVGCLTLGTLAAGTGYLLINNIWRFITIRKWGVRKSKKNNNQPAR